MISGSMVATLFQRRKKKGQRQIGSKKGLRNPKPLTQYEGDVLGSGKVHRVFWKVASLTNLESPKPQTIKIQTPNHFNPKP